MHGYLESPSLKVLRSAGRDTEPCSAVPPNRSFTATKYYIILPHWWPILCACRTARRKYNSFTDDEGTSYRAFVCGSHRCTSKCNTKCPLYSVLKGYYVGTLDHRQLASRHHHKISSLPSAMQYFQRPERLNLIGPNKQISSKLPRGHSTSSPTTRLKNVRLTESSCS